MNVTGAIYNDCLLNNTAAAQNPGCDAGSVESAVLRDNRFNATTVAYYSGTTPGSKACYICYKGSKYVPNTTTAVRVCLSNATWSGSPIVCGMLHEKVY